MTHNDSINPAINAIDERIALLAKELDDLRVAKKVLEGLSGVSAQVTRTLSPVTRVSESSGTSSSPTVRGGVTFSERYAAAIKEKGTNKDLFVSILRGSPDPWLTANEIQERVSELKEAEVPMSTVSPTLSDMKRQGIVVRNGFKVALAARVIGNDPSVGWGSQNKEPPSEEMF